MKALLRIGIVIGGISLGMISLGWAQEKVRGNYEVLKTLPKKHSLSKVSFEEFLNFGCPHCNNFHKLSKELRKQYEGKVEFTDIPILFQNQVDAPLRLYYVAKKLGRAEEVKQALFDANFKHGVSVFDPGIINYLARSLGLFDAYKKDGQSAWVSQAIAEGRKRANEYGIKATPTIVIAETLKMKQSHSMEAFVKQLPHTLDDLLVQK